MLIYDAYDPSNESRTRPFVASGYSNLGGERYRACQYKSSPLRLRSIPAPRRAPTDIISAYFPLTTQFRMCVSFGLHQDHMQTCRMLWDGPGVSVLRDFC